MRKALLLLLLILVSMLVACRQTSEPTAENITIDVAIADEMAMVGDATVLVTVNDEDGNPINDATVTVRGDMTHAGMVPVLPDPVSEADEGVYTIPFEFTMGGDWIIEVDVQLANGETATTTYEVAGVEGDMDMENMDMDGMDQEMMGAAVSGAFMNITNDTGEDITLLSASAEVAGMVEIHETVVDENDMASMNELEDGLTIPAGETVQLAPGGFHVMLMNLNDDLVEEETISLTLTFNNGTTIDLNVPVMGMLPAETNPVVRDGIRVEDYWARPTMLGDMDMESDDETDGMEMNATEESE